MGATRGHCGRGALTELKLNLGRLDLTSLLLESLTHRSKLSSVRLNHSPIIGGGKTVLLHLLPLGLDLEPLSLHGLHLVPHASRLVRNEALLLGVKGGSLIDQLALLALEELLLPLQVTELTLEGSLLLSKTVALLLQDLLLTLVLSQSSRRLLSLRIKLLLELSQLLTEQLHVLTRGGHRLSLGRLDLLPLNVQPHLLDVELTSLLLELLLKDLHGRLLLSQARLKVSEATLLHLELSRVHCRRSGASKLPTRRLDRLNCLNRHRGDFRGGWLEGASLLVQVLEVNGLPAELALWGLNRLLRGRLGFSLDWGWGRSSVRAFELAPRGFDWSLNLDLDRRLRGWAGVGDRIDALELALGEGSERVDWSVVLRPFFITRPFEVPSRRLNHDLALKVIE